MKTIGIFLFTILNFSGFAQDTIYMTQPDIFTEWIGSADTYSLTTLSSNKFVLAYKEGGVWEGRLRIGNISNDTIINYGDPYTYTTDMSFNGVEITKLSNSKFLLTYRTNYNTQIMVGEVLDNNHVRMGNSFNLSSGFVYEYSQIAISENTFIIAYYDPNTDYGKCKLGTINESLGISIDSTYTFTNSSITNSSFISIDTLSNTKFVIAYGYWDGKAIIGSIDDNDEITFGNSYNFTSNYSYYIDVIGLNENRFAVVYSDDYGAMKGTVVLGKTAENKSITYSDKFIYNDNETRGVSATRLSDDEIAIAFNSSGDDYNGYLIKTKIEGDDLSIAQKVRHNNSVGLNSYNPVSTLNNKRFLVLYPDGDSFNCFVRLCSTVEFDIVTSINQKSSSSYRLYPNPTNDKLFININNETKDNIVRVYDLQGRMFLENRFDTNEIIINLRGYKKGTYLIQLLNEDNQLTRKIIVE